VRAHITTAIWGGSDVVLSAPHFCHRQRLGSFRALAIGPSNMTNTKLSTRIFFAFAFLSAISVLNFIAMESASAQGSERHILIALDDSGSMGNERFPAGRPGNDP